jgi:VanZ family protein
MPPGKRTGLSETDPMKQLLRWMPQVFIAGLALVTIMSLIPSTSVPQAIQFWDKAQHALGYVALSVSGCLAFPQRVMPVVIGLLAHGAAIEIMKATLTTTRFGDVFDWLADGIGILAGFVIHRYALPKPAA